MPKKKSKKQSADPFETDSGSQSSEASAIAFTPDVLCRF